MIVLVLILKILDIFFLIFWIESFLVKKSNKMVGFISCVMVIGFFCFFISFLVSE